MTPLNAVFTDNDLKQLKAMKSYGLSPRTDDFIHYPQAKVLALLARLEAAEALNRATEKCDHEEWTVCDCGRKEAEAWLKAAGK